jgi:serine/threonine-protein kinase RsbW
VRRWLAPLGLPGQTEDNLVLAVSEAASNCVEHAYSPPSAEDIVESTSWTEPHAACIHIIDHGQWRTPCDQPTRRGRGTAITQQLIAFVLIHHDPRGTRVFPRHPLPADALNALHLTPSDFS